MNTSAFGVEKATLIRVPAIANLMVDSEDRPEVLDASGVDLVTPWNFQINKNQQLINGFFSRIGVTEVVLEWCIPNISESLGNQELGIRDSSGVLHIVEVPEGSYTVKGALDSIVDLLTAAAIPGYTWTIAQDAGLVFLDGGGTRVFSVAASELALKLGLNPLDVTTSPSEARVVQCPDLRPYRYIDFICNQLTAVQDVKDASTAETDRDVLVRWYFAWDEAPPLDAYGFPILMGYQKFVTRRLYNPPKQIKWEQSQNVGGFLQFQVYGDLGNLVEYKSTAFLNTPDRSNWLMTLQLSEG
jgi:hypothetical protein